MDIGRGLAGALQKPETASRRIPLRIPDAKSNMFIVAPLIGNDMAKLLERILPLKNVLQGYNACKAGEGTDIGNPVFQNSTGENLSNGFSQQRS